MSPFFALDGFVAGYCFFMFVFVLLVPLLTVIFVCRGGHMWEVMSSDGGSLQNCGLTVWITVHSRAGGVPKPIWGDGG